MNAPGDPGTLQAVAGRPWVTVAQGAAGLAAGLGVGRFAYTPILPMMTAHAGLSQSAGATIATDNYIGYLVGAGLGIAIPRLVRSSAVLRGSLVTIVATLALMPMTRSVLVWGALRLVAGAASALIFVIAAAAVLDHLAAYGARVSAKLTGWAFGGVGAGIALSGALVLVVQTISGWRSAWLATAVLAAVLGACAWNLAPEHGPREPSAAPVVGAPGRPRTGPWFGAVLASYTLEGVGYIIAGTFLVAAIAQSAAGWVGTGAWVLVGIAAAPSTVVWGWLSSRFGRPALLVCALAVQAVGIALPALVGGITAGLISAVLFGATFVGISSLSLAVGMSLQFPRAVAILTTGYSLGQIAGPLVIKPLLHGNYDQALLLGGGIVLVAALAAAALRVRFPVHGAPALSGEGASDGGTS